MRHRGENVREHIVYIATRVRGMKSRLLSRDALEELLDHKELDALIEVLLTTDYRDEMARALAVHEGAEAIEDAVSRHLMLTFAQLLTISGHGYRPCTALFLARWDIQTVKQLLRQRLARERGITSTGFPIPGPSLGVALVRHLAELDSLEALLQGLISWNRPLCACLWKVYSGGGAQALLRAMEDALDRAYFVENARRLAQEPDENAQILCQYLRMSIDGINLRILLHGKAHQDAHPDWLLPEGTLPKRLAAAMMAAENIEEAVALLESTIYRDLAEGLYVFLQTGRYSPMQRMFEQLLLRELRALARTRAMTLAPLMYYAWLKYNEVINLRLIARGGLRQLPRGRIREEMLHA